MIRLYSGTWRLAVLSVVVVAGVGRLAAAAPVGGVGRLAAAAPVGAAAVQGAEPPSPTLAVGGEPTSVSQQSGPKIYISADMEGLAGVVTAEQLGPTGFEYQRFRRFMTEEVLAAIEGARAAGAGEILVSDSHGNGQNLLIEMFPDDIQVIRSWPRPLMMMEGAPSPTSTR